MGKIRKGALLVMAGLAVATLTAKPAGAGAHTALPAIEDRAATSPEWIVEVPSAVLYDQYDNWGAVAVPSQNFEAVYDAYDCKGADDFVVPANTTWRISAVSVQGLYSFAPGPQVITFNVKIYQDLGGKPGAPRATRSEMSFVPMPLGEFRIMVRPPIAIPASLTPRHVWISVQANLAFAGGGRWAWTDRLVQSNEPAAWENPRDGFGVCPTWDTLDNCVGSNDGDDFVYKLAGTAITINP